MLILINNRDLMGQYTNTRTFDIISWITVAVMIVLTIMMVVTSFFQS
jgi:Mn2+/Fe2+ NRAMP family transporter